MRVQGPFELKLIREGYATLAQYEAALWLSYKENISVVEALNQVLQVALPPEVLHSYKQIQLFELRVLYGIATVTRQENQGLFASENLLPLLEETIPLPLCRQWEVLPLRRTDEEIVVGMVSPGDLQRRNEIFKLAEKLELVPSLRILTSEDFLETIVALNKYQEEIAQRPKEGSDSEAAEYLEYKQRMIVEIIKRIITLHQFLVWSDTDKVTNAIFELGLELKGDRLRAFYEENGVTQEVEIRDKKLINELNSCNFPKGYFFEYNTNITVNRCTGDWGDDIVLRFSKQSNWFK